MQRHVCSLRPAILHILLACQISWGSSWLTASLNTVLLLSYPPRACHEVPPTAATLQNSSHVLCILTVSASAQAFLTKLLTVDLPGQIVLPKRLDINIPPAVTAVAEAAVGRDAVMRAVASAVLQVPMTVT